MSRLPSPAPLSQSWEMMTTFRLALGIAGMQSIFSVGTTQIYRYCYNPDISDEAERNPLDRMRLLLLQAEQSGGHEAVMAAVAYMLEPLGLVDIQRDAEIFPDGDTVEAECLDDYPSLLRLHEGVRTINERKPMHPRAVQALLDDHVRECRETLERYNMEWERRP